MPHVLVDRSENLLSDFMMLQLCDPEHSELQHADPTGHTDDVGLAGIGVITFNCAEPDSDPVVHFQLWDGPPSEPASDPGFEGDLDVQHGVVVLGPPTASPSDMVIRLPSIGPYLVRAYRYEADRWLIQMWAR